MLGGFVKVVRGLQVGRVVQHAGRHGDMRLIQVQAYRVLVEDLGPLNSFDRAPVPIATNGGVFDVLDVQLHCFRIDLAAIVEQHALAQPKCPGGELLIGLPTHGDARDNVALLVIIGQASIHRRPWGRGVQLIVAVRVEASGIGTRAKLQYAAALRMALCRFCLRYETVPGGPNKRGTGCGKECSPAQLNSVRLSVHGDTPSKVSGDNLGVTTVAYDFLHIILSFSIAHSTLPPRDVSLTMRSPCWARKAAISSLVLTIFPHVSSYHCASAA